MIVGTPVLGLFSLACQLQDVDPLIGTPVSGWHSASLDARDGEGAMIGWSGIDGQENVIVRKMEDGTIVLSGLKIRETSAETWAVLKPIAGQRAFTMEWLMYDHPAKDGRQTVVVWSKGTCEQLAWWEERG